MMGYAERANAELRTSLLGLCAVVDVQHAFQPAKPKDRGSVFTLASGAHVLEAQASATYAAAIAHWLTARGARVLTNEPANGLLVGPYWTRNRAANAWGAHAYLACHVNAGGGDYCRAEYMVGSKGDALARAVGSAIVAGGFPVSRTPQATPISRGMRGAVCIEAVDRFRAAVILEPFFGDNPRHQAMLETAQLELLGATIGLGVASWWKRAAPAA